MHTLLACFMPSTQVAASGFYCSFMPESRGTFFVRLANYSDFVQSKLLPMSFPISQVAPSACGQTWLASTYTHLELFSTSPFSKLFGERVSPVLFQSWSFYSYAEEAHLLLVKDLRPCPISRPRSLTTSHVSKTVVMCFLHNPIRDKAGLGMPLAALHRSHLQASADSYSTRRNIKTPV